ncbi:hypothetical protein H0H92_005720, partial [Tricholoma furcatifolium]
MKLCLPCFPSSATQNLDDKPPKVRSVHIPISGIGNLLVWDQEGTDLANITIPDASKYAGIAAREFLSVLEAVAQQVPVPGFSSIVSVAANIIKACDTLVAVFVNELKGKKREDIHTKLLEDIESMKQCGHGPYPEDAGKDFVSTLPSTLAVMDNPDIKITSEKEGSDLRSDILAELNSSPPIIMVLDNFETLWNAEGAQSEVEHILQDICKHHVVISSGI